MARRYREMTRWRGSSDDGRCAMYAIDHVVLAVADLDEAGERLHASTGSRRCRAACIRGGAPRTASCRSGERLPRADRGRRSRGGRSHGARPRPARAHRRTARDRWFAICLADTDIDATAARLGLAVEPGARTRPDGARAPVAGRRHRGRASRRLAAVLHRLGRAAGAASGSRRRSTHDADVHRHRARRGRRATPARLRDWLGPRRGAADRRGRRRRTPASVRSDAARPRRRRPRSGSDRTRRSGQRPVEVLDQVVGVLDADRQPDEVGGHLER